MTPTLNHDQIAFFDMDGTLTPPRREISPEIVAALRDLSQYAHIVIITGSPLSYLLDQCTPLWNPTTGMDPNRLTLMPCNGTQFYTWDASIAQTDFRKYWRQDALRLMKETMGDEDYRKLIHGVMDLQVKVIKDNPSLPLSGNFVSYRDSMLNWCMIGRDATHDEREAFIKYDTETNLRITLRDQLKLYLHEQSVNDIAIALGGSTSIDIYPHGWSKTYGIKYCSYNSTKWFVGDKCEKPGNDYAIYRILQPLGVECVTPEGTSYKTTGPDKTLQIIRETLIPRIKEIQ